MLKAKLLRLKRQLVTFLFDMFCTSKTYIFYLFCLFFGCFQVPFYRKKTVKAKLF